MVGLGHCRDWSAVYLPSTERKNPSKSGFRSKRRAKRYARRFFCAPKCEACAAEWLIIPTQRFEESMSFADLLKAAGFEESKCYTENRR